MENKKLLTVNELAEKLRVDDSWVYRRTRHRKENRFPCIQVGGYLRFQFSDVLDWLKRKQEEGR